MRNYKSASMWSQFKSDTVLEMAYVIVKCIVLNVQFRFAIWDITSQIRMQFTLELSKKFRTKAFQFLCFQEFLPMRLKCLIVQHCALDAILDSIVYTFCKYGCCLAFIRSAKCMMNFFKGVSRIDSGRPPPPLIDAECTSASSPSRKKII